MLDESAAASTTALPVSAHLGAAQTAVAERRFTEVLAEVIGRDQVPVDGHFFDHRDVKSLVMAHFDARVRKRDDLPSVSHEGHLPGSPARKLAKALAEAADAPAEPPAPEVTVAPAWVSTVQCLGSSFHCFRARAGRIETGRVTLGREVYVGDKIVLARRACNDHSDFCFKGST